MNTQTSPRPYRTEPPPYMTAEHDKTLRFLTGGKIPRTSFCELAGDLCDHHPLLDYSEAVQVVGWYLLKLSRG